jgi:hypothetical protein
MRAPATGSLRRLMTRPITSMTWPDARPLSEWALKNQPDIETARDSNSSAREAEIVDAQLPVRAKG